MSQIHLIRRCYSCGAILQIEDPEKEGYIVPEIFLRPNAGILFCNKCYQEGCGSLHLPSFPLGDDQRKVLRDIASRDAFVVYVIDVCDFECGLSDDIAKALGPRNMMILANKRDLLPAKLDEDALREYVAHRFRLADFKAKKEDVFLSSLTSLADASALREELERRRQGHDVYLIGAKGSGKTMFLNAFLRGYTNKTRRSIVTKDYPGTALRVMEVPLDASSALYDIPGREEKTSIKQALPFASASELELTSPLNRRDYALCEGEALGNGVVFLQLVKGEKTAISFYASNEVKLGKYWGKDVEGSYFRDLAGGGLSLSSPSLTRGEDFAAYELEIQEEGSRDIGIDGFGWFSFEGAKQTFRLLLPKGVALYSGRSKIGKGAK